MNKLHGIANDVQSSQISWKEAVSDFWQFQRTITIEKAVIERAGSFDAGS